MADGLDPVRVHQAMARPGYGDELHALGVRDLSGFGPDEASSLAFDWPPWNEARIRELVDEALGPKTETPEERKRHQARDELDLGGTGYTREELRVANDLLAHERRLVARRLEEESGMSLRRALRFWHWHEAGAVCWDEKRGLHPGPGFRWAKRSGGRVTLVRSGSR